MRKFLKSLKINLLSILALPLLIIATAFKLVSKAMEKLPLLLSFAGITGFLVAGLRILHNPESLAKTLVQLTLLFVLGGIIVAVLVFLIRAAFSIISLIWNQIIHIFDVIYKWTYSAFQYLYGICEEDFDDMVQDGSVAATGILCLLFTLTKFFSRTISAILSWALPTSVLLSVLSVGGSIWYLHLKTGQLFGIGLSSYLGKFDTFSLINGLLLFIAIETGICVVLISLGIEWHEWALELRMTGEELDSDIQNLKDRTTNLLEDHEDTEYQDCLELLMDHVDYLDELGNMVEDLLDRTDSALLKSTWSTYFRSLSELAEICSPENGSLSRDRYHYVISRIHQLDRQREDVMNLIEQLESRPQTPAPDSVYFSGCNSLDKLEKRYKSLCKAYHPDTEGGDTETFQRMQEEYLSMKERLS